MTTEAHRAAADRIVAALAPVVDLRVRPMMGGRLLYVDGVLVGQVNEGELFVKSTAFGTSFAPEIESRPPYPGAKDALVVPEDRLGDAGWLHELLVGTAAALAVPSPRPRRTGAP